MTREEYLNELKSSIMSLTTDEQAEAIQYYSDYFDEADDDEKVMRELGTPEELAKEEDLVFLCGHYEGIDERVIEEIVTDEVSLGDFVLTGGELPAMVMVDCISRLIPGVLGSDESASDESFSDGLLEYPQYTRPEEWMGKKVPEVLLSGHHANIEKWRREKQIEKTLKVRPELLSGAELSKKEKDFLEQLKNIK